MAKANQWRRVPDPLGLGGPSYEMVQNGSVVATVYRTGSKVGGWASKIGGERPEGHYSLGSAQDWVESRLQRG